MIKRVFDLVIALVAMSVSTPAFAVIAVLIWWTMGRPILFRQERAGLHGRGFVVLKFRTMSEARGSNGELLPDEERVTRLGRFLRVTSLDELPSLLNVIRGDMSLVGPRPLLMEYLSVYTHEQGRRHDVRPGVTGLAQISGRNTISWEDRLALDTWYVANRDFWLDLRILAVTLLKVLKLEGAVPPGRVSMPKLTEHIRQSKRSE